MPTYTPQEVDDMAQVTGWTAFQVSEAVAGRGLTGHTLGDLLRALATALKNCLRSKAQESEVVPAEQ